MNFISKVRKILVISTVLLSTSCALPISLDYSYFGYFKNTFFPPEFRFDQEYYEEAGFSYLRVKHKKREAVFVLANIEDNVFTWVGSESETIKTYQGIIIEMNGVYNFFAFKNDLSYFNLSIMDNPIRYTFNNPRLVMHPFTFKLESIEITEECTDYTYRRESKVIGLSSQENICLDGKLPIRSSQKVNNLIDKFELEFNYKF
ncbi:MAG: hypothetical protein VW894_00005 [Gammaproteobacteria bacterium]